MTLRRYTPEMLDQLALRLLDVASQVRRMAGEVRRNGLEDAELHDKKALEWCERLEAWADRTDGQVAMQAKAKVRAEETSEKALDRKK